MLEPETYFSVREGCSLWIERDEVNPNRWQLFTRLAGNRFIGAAETPKQCAEMLSFGQEEFPAGWIRVFPVA